MTVTIYRQSKFAGEALDHRVVRHSQNLRAIQRHNRLNTVHRVAIRRDSDGGAILFVEWNNGDWTRVSFASFSVCTKWVDNRRRTWNIERVATNPDSVYYQEPAR